jgi:hypothetical protein
MLVISVPECNKRLTSPRLRPSRFHVTRYILPTVYLSVSGVQNLFLVPLNPEKHSPQYPSRLLGLDLTDALFGEPIPLLPQTGAELPTPPGFQNFPMLCNQTSIVTVVKVGADG